MTAAARRHNKRVGYVRVSTLDQNTERQLDGQDLDKVFTDKASGKDTKRPQLQAALDYLREGDSLVVHSMDRLARNLDDLRRIVLGLTSKGVLVGFRPRNASRLQGKTLRCRSCCSPSWEHSLSSSGP